MKIYINRKTRFVTARYNIVFAVPNSITNLKSVWIYITDIGMA
jgi:hypothetical protein